MLLFVVAMAAMPYLFLLLTFRAGWYLYSTYSALFEASWDVSLVFVTFEGAVVNGVIALAFVIVGSWRLMRQHRPVDVGA